MLANRTLLQHKYARIIWSFAEKASLSHEEALKIFYYSELYQLISEGISDMHCRSDEYLVDELLMEYDKTK